MAGVELVAHARARRRLDVDGAGGRGARRSEVLPRGRLPSQGTVSWVHRDARYGVEKDRPGGRSRPAAAAQLAGAGGGGGTKGAAGIATAGRRLRRQSQTTQPPASRSRAMPSSGR